MHGSKSKVISSNKKSEYNFTEISNERLMNNTFNKIPKAKQAPNKVVLLNNNKAAASTSNNPVKME